MLKKKKKAELRKLLLRRWQLLRKEVFFPKEKQLQFFCDQSHHMRQVASPVQDMHSTPPHYHSCYQPQEKLPSTLLQTWRPLLLYIRPSVLQLQYYQWPLRTDGLIYFITNNANEFLDRMLEVDFFWSSSCTYFIELITICTETDFFYN